MKFESSNQKPSTWSELRLADVCRTFTSGGTPSRKKLEYFQNGTVPWVRTKELNDGIVTSADEYITIDALNNSSAKILPKNTVLLAMYGATVGKLGILGIEAACNQACAAMIVRDDLVDYRFLYYLLLNHREGIVSQATGGAQQNLSGELIKEFAFDFPSLQEQRAIADVLWDIDEKILSNASISKTLEDIAKSTFKSWFLDFDPVTAKMAGEKPQGIDAGVASLFPDSFMDSELGEIPEGWDVKSAGELFEIGIGRTPPRKEPEWFVNGDKGVPWVSIKDMGTFGVYSHTTNEALTEAAVERFRVPIVPENTLLLSFKLTMGKLCITDRPMVTNEAIAHFRVPPEGKIDSNFAYLWLSNYDMSSLDSTSSIGTATNSGVIRNIKFLVPTEDVLTHFQQIIDPIFRKLKSLRQQSTTLSELRDSLLPRLISGELQISEEMLVS